MIIDFHTHLFPENMRDNRGNFFDGEPAFALLYDSEKSPMAGEGEILAAMDADGVDVSVVFGFPWQNPDFFVRHNDYIMEKAARHPDRLVPFACFDLYHPNAPREAARCLEAGCRGLGELAFYRSGIDEQALDLLEPVMEIARSHRAPVLIHTNEPVGHQYPGKTPITMAQIWNLVVRFPENPIILAHWGGGIFFFRLLKKNAEQAFRNLWVDTAASPYLYDPGIYRLAGEIFSPDRLLFGSDFPLLRPKRYFKEMDQAGLGQKEAEKLKGQNAARLLGISR